MSDLQIMLEDVWHKTAECDFEHSDEVRVVIDAIVNLVAALALEKIHRAASDNP